jgi:hydroxyacylglutathione hydrolase
VRPVTTTDLAEVRWIHGALDCERSSDPSLQVVAVDDATFVIRQSKCVHFEAPFLYLLLGTESALLHDTGATSDAGLFPIRRTVEELIGARTHRLLVTHSHGHGDHRAGDEQFADLPEGSIARTGVEGVAAFFGIDRWPEDRAVLDLGGRPIDVIPTPGHLADHVVLFDRSTGLLLSGDTLLPGTLAVRDWEAYRASTKRLVRFADEAAARGCPIRWILGGHIEMRTTGERYPFGTTYQPDEVPLPLRLEDLVVLDALLDGAGASPRSLVGERYVVEPVESVDG